MHSDPALKRCVEFMVSKQRADGGWGESYLSCQDKVRARGGGGEEATGEGHLRCTAGVAFKAHVRG